MNEFGGVFDGVWGVWVLGKSASSRISMDFAAIISSHLSMFGMVWLDGWLLG
jgi:hypothetical protein